MAYATQSDITTLYSENALYVADRDGDGAVDTDAVARALSLASDEIDSYIGVRYKLPLTAAPGLLLQFCVDIALYRLASSGDVLTDDSRRRYDDTIKHLKDISRGAASLVLPDTGDGSETSEPTRPRPIVTGGPAREFTRDKLWGF